MTRWPSWQLFAVAVLIWSTTWHAIVHQLAGMPASYGVTLRFALAAAAVLALAAWRRERLWFGVRAQALLALQGVFMYGLAYLCVYEAERHVSSGLVALGYSASPLLMGLGAWALWRVPVSARFVGGGLCGVAGVALLFAPELAQTQGGSAAARGLAFTAAAVGLSAVGALAASRNTSHRLPFWPALGWGLAWGAAAAGAVALLSGPLPPWPTAAAWWISLAWLSLAGTVVAFSAYLTLQQRLGPGKAASVGVMTPLFALAVSTLLEGYQPSGWTLAGALLVVAGNGLMLRR
ncbi:MAG: DMT family transporter [Rubrivivax sp.]|nr:DMT family transporter [Rubrivivax sp.]